MTDTTFAPLTSDEEVTLRRVAFGESPASTLRARDLARLRHLRLIDGGREPQLTAGGRARFEALPKAAMMGKRSAHSLDEEIARLRKETSSPAKGRP